MRRTKTRPQLVPCVRGSECEVYVVLLEEEKVVTFLCFDFRVEKNKKTHN